MNILRWPYQPKQHHPAAYSLIDIGRDTVKAVVVLVKPGTSDVEIVGYGLASSGGHNLAGGRLEAAAVAKPVNQALTLAEDSTEAVVGHKIVPDEVIFAASGQATIGELFVVEQVRAKPAQPITQKEITQLRAKAARAVQKGLADLTRDQGPWKPLAINDVGLRIDQHTVLDGVGLTGRELSLSVFGVAVQRGLWRALEAVAKQLNLTVANVVTAPQALAGLVPHSEAIVLDVGLIGTTIALIREDALAAAKWLPIGGDFFTRRLAEKTGRSAAEAAELKHAFTADKLANDETEYLDHLLDDDRQQWHESVVNALARLSPDAPLPWKIYLTGGGSILPGLDLTFRVNPAYFDRVPDVTRIRRPYLTGIKDLTKGLDYNRFSLALSLIVGIPDRLSS